MADRFLTPKKNLDGSRQLRAKEVQSGTDIKAGAGLVITNGTIGHSNSVTAGTNNRIRCGAIDSEGHFTGSQTEYEVTTSIDTDHPSDTKLPTENGVKNYVDTVSNGRAKTDLSNVPASKGILVDSYYDEETGDWYKKYSDGWIEQGGIYYKASSIAGNNTITFLLPFTTTKYIFLAMPLHTAASASGIGADLYNSRTITTTILAVQSAFKGYEWRACGY